MTQDNYKLPELTIFCKDKLYGNYVFTFKLDEYYSSNIENIYHICDLNNNLVFDELIPDFLDLFKKSDMKGNTYNEILSKENDIPRIQKKMEYIENIESTMKELKENTKQLEKIRKEMDYIRNTFLNEYNGIYFFKVKRCIWDESSKDYSGEIYEYGKEGYVQDDYYVIRKLDINVTYAFEHEKQFNDYFTIIKFIPNNAEKFESSQITEKQMCDVYKNYITLYSKSYVLESYVSSNNSILLQYEDLLKSVDSTKIEIIQNEIKELQEKFIEDTRIYNEAICALCLKIVKKYRLKS